MVIEAGGIVIDMQLMFLEQFENIKMYEVEKKPNFFMLSASILPSFEFKKFKEKTTYYEVYDTNLGTLQLQFSKEENIGAILYQENKVTIFPFLSCFEVEYLLSQYAFVYWIKKYTKSLFIHASSIVYQDAGILFCAKSGTGKSTQRMLWEKYGNAICLNDDKNILRQINGQMYLMPNPWGGKHFVTTNIRAELKAIVFLYQSKENIITPLKKEEAFLLILKQTQLPSPDTVESWNECIDLLCRNPLLHFGCNMEEEAFLCLKDELMKRGIIR